MVWNGFVVVWYGMAIYGHIWSPRVGEVYLATCNYQPALEAFQRAFQCQDSDKVACKDLMDRSKRELAQDIRQGEQLPWVGCALGMVLSSLVIVLDYLSHGRESTLAHPVLKVAVCMLAAGLGYWAGRAYRRYTEGVRRGMVEPPVDLLGDMLLPNTRRQHED